MKKLITTAAFLMLGTMFITAQTTKNNNPSTMPEKPANSTEMKIATPVQPNGMNRTIDTATMNHQSKMQSNPNRLQNQKRSTETIQNQTTMPQSSTATPQLQPVSPVEPKATK